MNVVTVLIMAMLLAGCAGIQGKVIKVEAKVVDDVYEFVGDAMVDGYEFLIDSEKSKQKLLLELEAKRKELDEVRQPKQ